MAEQQGEGAPPKHRFSGQCSCILSVVCRSDDANDDPDAFELDVNEEVVIPLAAAVRAPPPLTARRKDEVSRGKEHCW